MNIKIPFVQKEAFLIGYELSADDGDTPDWSTATYTALGAKTRAAFNKEYSEADPNYLFKIEDADIKDVSNLSVGILNIPIDTNATDYYGNIELMIIAEIDDYARAISIDTLEFTAGNKN